jgi:hypothetical protein
MAVAERQYRALRGTAAMSWISDPGRPRLLIEVVKSSYGWCRLVPIEGRAGITVVSPGAKRAERKNRGRRHRNGPTGGDH